MTQDISVTVLAVLAGGPIGVFTVIAAFFTGPLITRGIGSPRCRCTAASEF